ncbi:hypothetical protein [Solidesulfovibrio sp.]
MTNMHFPFGSEADLIGKLLANYGYRAVVNHRDQWYYQTKMVWRGRLVHCRLGRVGLSRLPDDLYSETWCGYYDASEPDSMLYDEVHPNIFACIKRNHMEDAA